MTDNEFLLFDRLEKIKSVIGQYGEDNFYISFSGGKDSTVLSWLIDEALPGNRIPRVYADTGIELNMVRDFVYDLQKTDDRIVIIKPSTPIKPMLERDGYPFKSKEHSHYVNDYQNNGMSKTSQRYLEPEEKRLRYKCPNILRYQFTKDFDLKISPKCCDRLKKEPLKDWQKRNGKPYSIIGLMTAEGGADRMQNVSLSVETRLKRFNRSYQSQKNGKNGSLRQNRSGYAIYTSRRTTLSELGVKAARSR